MARVSRCRPLRLPSVAKTFRRSMGLPCDLPIRGHSCQWRNDTTFPPSPVMSEFGTYATSRNVRSSAAHEGEADIPYRHPLIHPWIHPFLPYPWGGSRGHRAKSTAFAKRSPMRVPHHFRPDSLVESSLSLRFLQIALHGAPTSRARRRSKSTTV